MEINNQVNHNIKFTNRGLIIKDCYIISDLHIGYSDTIQSMTIKDEKDEIIPKIRNVLETNDIEKVIMNGDIFHPFRTAKDFQIDVLDKINSIVNRNCKDMILVEGNHDENTVENLIYNFSDYYNLNNITVTHGHKMKDQDSDLYILGHIHPTVRINGVMWPTYLYGYSKDIDSDILVLPTFSNYQDGVVISSNTDLNIECPYVNDFGNMYPYIYDSNRDIVRELPKLKHSDKYMNI